MITTFIDLRNRYVVSGTLCGAAGLHIGSGLVAADTDAPFVRLANRPFLPGSSLRGAFRSLVERTVRSLSPPGEPLGCTLFEEAPAAGRWACHAGNSDLRKEFESLSADKQTNRLAEPGFRICPVCQLFGSTLMAARLKINDATLREAPRAELVKRDGVGINRDTETAHPGIKYDFEVLEPPAEFDFSLQVDNATREDFALLYILIQELHNGIEVGGKRSRGMGTVRLQAGYKVEYFDSDRGYPLRRYLTDWYQTDTTGAFEQLLKQKFEEVFGNADAGN
jgi:CRISPR-associated RAMP protein (TIGR02581 family)